MAAFCDRYMSHDSPGLSCIARDTRRLTGTFCRILIPGKSCQFQKSSALDSAELRGLCDDS
jgi:hypothetical protein